MDDLIIKYGGIANLKKYLNLFYEKVCEEKKIKHYFFGINIEHAIQDVVNYRSFVMRKPEHLYSASPIQTAPSSIKVRIPVFEEVLKLLELVLQKEMKVAWQDVARFAHHIMEIFEESRCKSMDSVKMSIESDFVSIDRVNLIFTKKQVRTKILPNGDLMTFKGFGLEYPIHIQLLQKDKKIALIGKGYAREGVEIEKVEKVLKLAREKFPFYPLDIRQDETGRFIQTLHEADFSADGIPIRLFLSLAQNFSKRFEEVMALDKDEQLINLVRDV